MAIREDLVASAAQFLQDPTVASSTTENKILFLRSKNLTEEEIGVALARVGGPAPSNAQYSPGPPPPPLPPSESSQQYYSPYAQQAWQPLPSPAPRRDWRDWFIMATVVSGVSYGLYSLSKRYVYPLIAPPTPDRLEQDKKSIEEQFDRAFSLVEQIVKDTEALKDAEQQRTEKLDSAMVELETVMTDLKSANRRREDDAQRIRDEVQTLKLAIPKAMDNQKSLIDSRLSEINTELSSLKTLISQRLASGSSSVTTNSHARPSGAPLASSRSTTPTVPTVEPVAESSSNTSSTSVEASKSTAPGIVNRPSSFSNGGSATKASIPAWQMAAAASSSSAAKDAESGGG